MKIGIDISQVAYEGTGVATYTRSLVENIVRLGKSDDFVLFASSFRGRQPVAEFVKSLPAKNIKKKFSYLPPKLLEFLWNGIHVLSVESLTGSLDVFHSSDWLEPPTRSAKRVTTIHDLAVYKYPESFSPKGGHDIVKNQKRKLFFVKQYSHRIIAVSENTKKDIMEILGVSDKKIVVIHEAADPLFFPREKEEREKIREKYGIKGEFLFCAGTREPRKNLARLIAAFAELSRAYPELDLVIAGKYGWGDDLGADHKLQNTRVKVLGFVPKEDLACLYSSARAFIYPSLYEGFGLPILEAMACGCPVVTSNLGSMKEIAAGSSVLIDPGSVGSIADGISKVLRSDKLREELRIKGLKRVGDFSWEKTALQTLEVYRSLLE